MSTNYKYCKSLTEYSRFQTREVQIGDIALGGENPIRIQSMTTTDTMDTIATVEQTIRMVESGCEYVRITAPSIKEAHNLQNIKSELVKRGCNVPLIADIHFTPNAAEIAARIVEKVRVNPGNYADKKKFQQIEYTDAEYNAEIERIHNRFSPLVKICKEEGAAMRIGTNHGSLSDRIMSRYGDTPLGMVESALEFLRICEDHNYYDVVLSMKSSNTQVMVQAYRLLVNKMMECGMNYPLHIGVTEAGEGEDGRIKSAVGIGTLLEDGLGDTVRVSLTEEPEFESPVAIDLAERYMYRADHKAILDIQNNPINPFEYSRRESISVNNIGGKNVPVVIGDLSAKEKIKPSTLFALGYNYSVPLDKWNITDTACDYIYCGNHVVDFEIPGTLGLITNYQTWLQVKDQQRTYPLLTVEEYTSSENLSKEINFLQVTSSDLKQDLITRIKQDNTAVLILQTNNKHGVAEIRREIIQLINGECSCPVIINRSYNDLSEQQLQLFSATDLGSHLIDGFGDGVWVSVNSVSPKFVNETCFRILQAARMRISATEYISCPSCGRTLFDLQETTAKIRAKTDHLKGVKIAIMGCIVNGPGEMADADYGYVGTGPGKITLYKGKEVVKRNVPSEGAVDELINLIKENGDWVELQQEELIAG
ncbi:(E)-4-hydroxy-3-methylbut-2-enyl-diphosphate synthase [bacterium AH-315-C07]|nr:(E)-4-hydroxy-3-methylbut-2-enyl-diphosphate synthase [bacterium AH-315-C07]